MANRKEPADRAVAASRQLPKTVGALAGDDSADIADSGCAGSGAGRDVMERQRTGGAKPHPCGGTVLNVVPGAEADCEFTLSGDDGAEKYRPQADDTRLLAELSAIASTLKSASLSDIEMRGFTFDQNARYFTSSYGPRTLPVSTNCVVYWQPIMLCNRTRYRKRVMRFPAA